ncbi:MAG: GNAT family N-acetyltransferase [Allobaculum sp.]
MEVRHTTAQDIPELLEIFENARQFMRETGNPNQWKDNRPDPSLIYNDIILGQSYVAEDKGVILGVFSLIFGDDPTYGLIENGRWRNHEPYAAIHRIASSHKGHGFFDALIHFCFEQCQNLRIDTHPDNEIMQKLILRHGFSYCGIIYTDDGTQRLAYQITPEDIRGMQNYLSHTTSMNLSQSSNLF